MLGIYEAQLIQDKLDELCDDCDVRTKGAECVDECPVMVLIKKAEQTCEFALRLKK